MGTCCLGQLSGYCVKKAKIILTPSVLSALKTTVVQASAPSSPGTTEGGGGAVTVTVSTPPGTTDGGGGAVTVTVSTPPGTTGAGVVIAVLTSLATGDGGGGAGTAVSGATWGITTKDVDSCQIVLTGIPLENDVTGTVSTRVTVRPPSSPAAGGMTGVGGGGGRGEGVVGMLMGMAEIVIVVSPIVGEGGRPVTMIVVSPGAGEGGEPVTVMVFVEMNEMGGAGKGTVTVIVLTGGGAGAEAITVGRLMVIVLAGAPEGEAMTVGRVTVIVLPAAVGESATGAVTVMVLPGGGMARVGLGLGFEMGERMTVTVFTGIGVIVTSMGVGGGGDKVRIMGEGVEPETEAAGERAIGVPTRTVVDAAITVAEGDTDVITGGPCETRGDSEVTMMGPCEGPEEGLAKVRVTGVVVKAVTADSVILRDTTDVALAIVELSGPVPRGGPMSTLVWFCGSSARW